MSNKTCKEKRTFVWSSIKGFTFIMCFIIPAGSLIFAFIFAPEILPYFLDPDYLDQDLKSKK